MDDASEQDHLGHQLEEYCSKLPVPVHVFRTGKRSGLIRARLLGAKHVKGSVITFLGLYLINFTYVWVKNGILLP